MLHDKTKHGPSPPAEALCHQCGGQGETVEDGSVALCGACQGTGGSDAMLVQKARHSGEFLRCA